MDFYKFRDQFRLVIFSGNGGKNHVTYLHEVFRTTEHRLRKGNSFGRGGRGSATFGKLRPSSGGEAREVVQPPSWAQLLAGCRRVRRCCSCSGRREREVSVGHLGLTCSLTLVGVGRVLLVLLESGVL